MLSIVTLSLLIATSRWVQGQDLVQPGPPEFCYKTDFHYDNLYHKDSPSPEDKDFPECTSWQHSSCCTHTLADEVSRFADGVGLYNWSRTHCGPLSQRCVEYYKEEDCFFWCEPMLEYFKINLFELTGIPVCAEYCDAWFEACKDDLTCVDNWGYLVYHNLSVDYTSSCPQNSTCRTYREVYGDGRGLCNKMWGSVYFYSTDRDNCTVMAFDNSMANPNFKLTFPRSSSVSQTVKWGSILSQQLALLMLFAIAAAEFY